MCVYCVCKIAECINYVNYVKYSVNKRGGKAFSPQTDSVPSVDRAISCFNKHVFLPTHRRDAHRKFFLMIPF